MPTNSHLDDMCKTLQVLDKINRGLIMTNLADFDMLYRHRLDSAGFVVALQEFEEWLPELLKKMLSEDLLIIAADHGCDPTTPGTNHRREYVPLLLFPPAISGSTHRAIRQLFVDVGATVADSFQISLPAGQSFLSELCL